MTSIPDLLKAFGVPGAIGALIYLVLQRRLDKRLEITKHELQIEYQKKSIVFEHQKDSFRNVLVGMHRAIEAIRGGPEPEWRPTSHKTVDAFRRIVSEEALFMDEESDHALRIFVQVMWSAAAAPFETEPSDEEMRLAATQTAFIADRLSEHFRARVGLVTDNGSLDDVELLGACRLINRHYFSKFNLPTTGLLAFRPGETASESVELAWQNLDLLRSELNRLKEAINSDGDRASLFFQVGTEVDRYLAKLRTFNATKRNERR